MKKIIKLLLSILIISFIIMTFLFSIKNLNKDEENNNSSKDVLEEIVINQLPLEINYIGGNIIDDSLTYGNVSNHEIQIKNNNQEKISFAIYFNEKEVSNDLLSYDIYYKIKAEDSYEIISKNNSLKDNVLLYNITIDEFQELFLKVEFKANKEGEATTISGILKIDDNVSETEIFNQTIHKVHNNISKRIEELNGISESAYYTLDVKSFIDKEMINLKGVVFIDALDISNPKFYYSIYNDKYMLNDYLYSNENIKKNDIKNIDKSVITNFDEESICKSHTKKECLLFSNIKYNSKGDKSTFSSSVESVLNLVKNKHSYNEKKVYVYDIKEDINSDSDIRGYILIDNSNLKNEYYLYITNNLYMVSGYNITKYGMFKENSPTIRAYNETSFKLSAESKNKVCEFTGFTECFDVNNKKV